MDETKEFLRKFINSKSKFFSLKEGEEKIVKYLFAEPIITNYQGNSIDSIRYHFEVDGKEMLWDRSSRELAIQMEKYSRGDLLSIKFTGQKSQTKYFIRKVG